MMSHALRRLSMVCLLAIAPGVMAATAKPPKYAPEGDIEAGLALSQEKGCAGCHGADGNSPVPMFPKIAGLGERYLLKQLNDIQSNVRMIPEMAGILDGLSEQELLNMAAYYNSQTISKQAVAPLEVLLNEGIKVDGIELGARVFRGGNLETNVPSCTGCHSPSGLGNEAAGYPRLGQQYAEYLEKQLRAFRAGERVNDGESMIMRGVAKNMSDAEIKGVSAFLSGLQPITAQSEPKKSAQ